MCSGSLLHVTSVLKNMNWGRWAYWRVYYQHPGCWFRVVASGVRPCGPMPWRLELAHVRLLSCLRSVRTLSSSGRETQHTHRTLTGGYWCSLALALYKFNVGKVRNCRFFERWPSGKRKGTIMGFVSELCSRSNWKSTVATPQNVRFVRNPRHNQLVDAYTACDGVL